MKFSSIDIRDLYPYGTPMLTSTGVSANPYKYGGKEFETEEGLKQYDFEARSLIPQIGMFTSQDPNAANYPWLNPYLYCTANPLKYIDPTGEDYYTVSEYGYFELKKRTDDNFDRIYSSNYSTSIDIDKSIMSSEIEISGIARSETYGSAPVKLNIYKSKK